MYYVEIVKTIEFCSTCREKYGKDYIEDTLFHHSHSHRYENVIILSKDFMDEDDLIEELIAVLAIHI